MVVRMQRRKLLVMADDRIVSVNVDGAEPQALRGHGMDELGAVVTLHESLKLPVLPPPGRTLTNKEREPVPGIVWQLSHSSGERERHSSK